MKSKEEALWLKAQNYFNQFKFAQSLQVLLKIPHGVRVEYPDMQFLLAENYYQTKQFLKAKHTCHEIPVTQNNQTALLNLQGRVEVSLGNIVTGIRFLKKSIEASTTNENEFAIKALIEALVTFNLYKEAIPHLNKLLNYAEYYEFSANSLIDAYMFVGETNKARALVNSVLARMNIVGLNNNLLLRLYSTCKQNSLFDLADKVFEQVDLSLLASGQIKALELDRKYQDKDYAGIIKLASKNKTNDLALLTLIADSFHKEADYKNAWNTYSKQKKIKKATTQKLSKIPYANFRRVLNYNIESLNRDKKSQIVFMTGFPRSGTTLIETVLDSSQQLTVLSEQPTVLYLVNYAKSTFGYDYPSNKTKLTTEQVGELRDAYFDYISRILGKDVSNDKVILDKHPSVTIYTHFIKQIFPEAKILMPIRHPMDTCLSCFRQNFVNGWFNNHLLDIKGIFDTYKETFELWEFYKNNLDIDYLEVKYEDVVSNFAITIKGVCDFIGIEFTESMKHFHNYAQNEKHVRSASKDQVTQPLYNSSVNAWCAYKEYLAPYKKYVEPVAKRYGYDIG